MISRNYRRLLGLCFLFITCAAWIGASFITQFLVSGGHGDAGPEIEPWLLTLICSSTFCLYLPIGLWARRRAASKAGASSNALASAAAADDEEAAQAEADSAAGTPDGSVAGGSKAPVGLSGGAAAAASKVRTTSERQPLLGAGLGAAATEDRGGGGGGGVLKGGLDEDAGDEEREQAGAEGDGAGGEVALSTIVKAAMLVAPVWFAAQLTFTASLEFTSVTSNTVLSSCSSLFVYLGALALRQERGSHLRLASVVAAMAGTTLVTLADRRSGGDGSRAGGTDGGGGGGGTGGGSAPLLGDGLTLLAAALYAAYTLVMRKMLVKDDAVVTALFFGSIGALCAALLLPLAAGLAAAGSGVVTRVTGQALGLALVQGLVDYVAADYAWARAVMLLGPTATSCGLAMQIPAAAVIDALANGNKLAWTETPARLAQFLTGSVLIIGGFMGVSLEPRALAAWLQRWRQRRAGGGGIGGGGGGHSSSAAGLQGDGSGGVGRGQGRGGGVYEQAGLRDVAAAAGPGGLVGGGGGGDEERTRLLGAASGAEARAGLPGSGALSGTAAREAPDEVAAASIGSELGSRSKIGSGVLEGTGGVAGRALRAVGQALGRGGAAAAAAVGGGSGGESYIPLADKSNEGR